MTQVKDTITITGKKAEAEEYKQTLDGAEIVRLKMRRSNKLVNIYSKISDLFNFVTGSVFVDKSITGNGSASSPLQLVNDEASPAASNYYGTDASGNKGFHNLSPPIGEVDPVFDAWRDAGLAKNLAETVTQIDWHLMKFRDAANKLAADLGTNVRVIYYRDGTSKLLEDDGGASVALYAPSQTSKIQVADTDFYVIGAGASGSILIHTGEAVPSDNTFGLIDNEGHVSVEAQLRTLNNTGGGAVVDYSAGFKSIGDWAFNNQAPSATQTGYSVANPVVNRTLDVSTATLAELRQIVGTMIADDIAKGLRSA